MPGASSIVANQFSSANAYATAAAGRAENFIAALNSVVGTLQPPDLNIDVQWPTAPTLAPAASVSVGAIPTNFPSDDTGIAPASPGVTLTLPEAPDAPSLVDYTFTPGPAPERPVMEALTTVALPDAPEAWTPPPAPSLLSISVRSFEGVDGHGDWAARLSEMPDDLVLAAPTGYTAPQVNRYDSGLLTDMINLLRARAAGGTGLAPAVEQALWDRARSRDAAAAAVAVDDIVKNAEARGFALPTGAMHAMLRDASKTLQAKSAEISRDIAIKQADLEQKNAQDAIAQGIQLETQLIQYTNNIEQRAFDSAKFAASNAVEIYNAVVSKYRALLEKYNTYASIYRSLIEGEKAKVDVYRAEIDAERAKVDINKALIEQRRTEIEVRNAYVSLYKAELEAVQTVISVDKLRVESFAERVRAYVAEIGAETARVETYKAQLQGNAARSDIYKNQVEAFSASVNANATAARARAEVYDAEVRAYASRTQAYLARVNAEAEKVRALVSAESLRLEGAKLDVQRATSNNQVQIENYRALLVQYESAKQLAMSATKLLSDNYFALKSMVTDASKVGAQVNAQMAASAYGTLRVGAEVQGSDSTQVQFSYNGDTSDTQSAPQLSV